MEKHNFPEGKLLNTRAATQAQADAGDMAPSLCCLRKGTLLSEGVKTAVGEVFSASN